MLLASDLLDMETVLPVALFALPCAFGYIGETFTTSGGQTIQITHPDFATFRAGHEELMKYQATLTTKAQILEALRAGGEEFASWLATLSDETLAERVYFQEGAQPPSKTRFEMLLSPKEHEMHHRAQLMVVERMVGIVPHLTREQQERAAAMERQPASARAGTA